MRRDCTKDFDDSNLSSLCENKMSKSRNFQKTRHPQLKTNTHLRNKAIRREPCLIETESSYTFEVWAGNECIFKERCIQYFVEENTISKSYKPWED